MEFKNDCRGLEAKKSIIEKYTIRILYRWTVLNQKEPLGGCCGALTDEAYTFEYEDKANAKISGTFHVGYHCAEQFLNLLNLPKPPLVNLLRTLGSGGAKLRDPTGADKAAADRTLHPLNREVELAAVIILQAWGEDPREPIRDTLKALRARPLVPVQDSRIKALITVISHDQQHRTLAQMAQDLRKDNPEMLQPSFPEILKIVAKLNLRDLIE